MNQKRFNQMRSIHRGQEQQGLQQILQPSAAGQLPPGQGGNQGQQTLRRKMTYTRTELLCRGLPTTQNPRRSPRNRVNTVQQPPATPQTPISAGHATATGNRQRSYVPRVPRLQSPNRNLTRMRTEIDLKPESLQVKKTPRLPNTPHVSHCSIPLPGPGVGHRPIRPEGSGIPVLDRSRNRDGGVPPKQRDNNKERIEIVGITDTSSRSSSPAERTKLGKPIPLPEDPKNTSFVYLCKPVKKVKELLTARQLRHSCENLELAGIGNGKLSKLQKTNSEEMLHSKAMEQGLELSSITEMSITPTSSTVSQLHHHHHHHHQLHQLHQLKQKQQQEDSNQERLLSQLNELRQRQQYLSQKEQRQKEMDMVCQNLPTLQHEIRLLQELNVKLETTLRGSNAANQRCSLISHDMERSSSTAFYTPRCGPMLFMEMPLMQIGFQRVEQRARITHRLHVVAIAHSLAVVREFRIETKTLNELKASDETQCFYLPQPKIEQKASLVNINSPESNPPPLQCTNLRMLRENPDVLIQQLRRGGGGGGAGGGSGSYSLLDHDMFMFINSLSKKSEEGFLYSTLAVGIPSKDNLLSAAEFYQHHNQHHQHHQRQLPALQSPEFKQVNSTTQTELEEDADKEQVEVVQDAPQAPKKKMKKLKQKARIIKRSPIQSNVEPKVRLKLFKTVLVGFVQVAVFLVLIMAFMYPDASC
ncbi:hypothetical protein KR032_004276 [Drosophila birchii]|nr:hypothetical protein KR032_004276 [Drosophila birchii]